MTHPVFYILPALLGYLLGCSNMALYLSKLKGVDLRAGGSGNLGTSNALILMGWKAGVLTGIHDIGKAAVAVLLAKWLFPALSLAGVLAGVCCVLGHIFPFYLKFKGGKGLASYLGMTIALNWKFAIVLLLVVVLITLITDYIVIGTVTTVLVVPPFFGYTHNSLHTLCFLAAVSLIMLYLHRANYVRIWNGTEIGLRSAGRGDHRKK